MKWNGDFQIAHHRSGDLEIKLMAIWKSPFHFLP